MFLASFGRPLLVIHALLAFALLGAATHAAVVSLQLLRGRSGLQRLARVYAQVLGALLGSAFAIGLLMYPHYRYAVRGLFLDRYEPWASNLFDLKENLAAFALALGAPLFVIGRRLDVQRDRAVLPLFAFLCVASWALVLCASVMGLIVTSVKGV